MKAWFTSKTLWVNFSIGFVGLVTTILGDAPIPDAYQGLALAGIGAVNMFLRSITTTAVGASSS